MNNTYKLSNEDLTNVKQTEKALPNQIKNKAGGYVFQESDVQRIRRFLILGTESGTYYAGSKELTLENAKFIKKMAETNGELLLDQILDVSLSGAAPKQSATLLALAILVSFGSVESRTEAFSRLPEIVRTGSHLFEFVSIVDGLRGWGRGLRKAVAKWYTEKDSDKLAYQMVKYRQRKGWTHRDLLRKSHPSAEGSLASLFSWAVGGDDGFDALPTLVTNFIKLQNAEKVSEVLSILKEDKNISWEMIPDKFIKDKDVWSTLIENGIPLTALIRNLPRMTNLGMFDNFSRYTAKVVGKLNDPEYIRKSRVHPVTALEAYKTYSAGASFRGSNKWTPNRKIENALNKTFLLAFDNVESTDKNTYIGLDVSGSMWQAVNGSSLTSMEVGAALAMVIEKSNPNSVIRGFTQSGRNWRDTSLTELSITHEDSIKDTLSELSKLPFGGTDVALPILDSIKNELWVDTFVIITDNETYGGYIHPFQALEQYRSKFNKNAKLIVLGVTAIDSTVTNPDDLGSLSVVGWDPAIPSLIKEFSEG